MINANLKDNSDAEIEIDLSKPYIATSGDYYIEISTEELRVCKSIGRIHLCEENFLVKHKSKITVRVPYFSTYLLK